MIKVNKYVMVHDGDSIAILDIVQDVNRPNNPDDYDIIQDWIVKNYGAREINNFAWIRVEGELVYIGEDYSIES